MDLRPRTNPISLGALLGFVNTLLIAIGMSAEDSHDRIGAVLLITMIACLPAVLTGAILGAIASALATSSIWLRRALVVPPALGLVGGLGLMFGLTSFVPIACIPTLACGLYLERRTRREATLPLVVVRREIAGDRRGVVRA
ncbi:MAG: hypothetical protein ABJE66_29985 [Deltaproteobacteria bacterium]